MVQEFKQREVEQSGQVPGYQNVSYPPDAFGASIGRALQGFGDTLSNLGQMQSRLDAEKKANDVLDTANQARDALRPVLYDPNNGIFSTSGKNAMEVNKTLDQALGKIQTDILDKETDPQKQQLLRKIWLRETEQAKDKVAVHQLNELGKYKQQTAKATMLGAMEDAYNNYNDEDAIQSAIQRSIDAIGVNSEGLPNEAIDLMLKESISNIRLAAISRWASEDPTKALTYYQEHKSDLTGKDHISATQLVKTARKAFDIQHATAQIVNRGDSSFFRQHIVPNESGNDPTAVSSANAIGLSQLTLPTARDMAKVIGREDLNGLSDAELKQKLIDDPELNLKLGEARWNQQLRRLGGDMEAALVAYNAGPEAADAFLEHNAGNPPGQRDYNVPNFKGIKSETEGYVQKILGNVRTRETPPGQRMTKDNWTLKNFKPENLIAPTPGGAWVDARAAQALDQLTDNMKQRFRGFQIKINEEHVSGGTTAGRRRGTADPADNPHVKKSQHLYGKAFDVQVQNWTTEEKQAFIAEARKLGFKGFGFYGPRGHLHIDMGPERTWGSVPNWAVESLKTPLGQQVPDTAETQNVPTGVLGANDSSGYFIDTRKSALAQWMTEAEGIDDPEIRQGVQAQLRIQAATIDNAVDAENNAVKQAAWDHLANGGSVKDLRPDELARMDPSFVNTLSEYEAKRNKGDVTTDWGAYAQIQQMSEEELVKTDIYTEFGAKLAPAELKEQLNRQRETRKKLTGDQHDEELLANSRTRSQIVDDIAISQGWAARDPQVAQFNRIFGERILGEQALKGKKLTEIEMQDIADKLLIEDKVPGVLGSKTLDLWTGKLSQGRALEAKSPNDFVAASDWSEVQPDDQKVLIDYYERQFGTSPNEQEATDIYNRAMRVWLGAPPDGPEDEKTALRGALETVAQRQLTDAQFEKAYGRYLLSFLGR